VPIEMCHHLKDDVKAFNEVFAKPSNPVPTSINPQ
jgi:hypothetical protein